MKNVDSILLVQPPYLRLVGSHNDRIPLELCYLNAHLRNAGFCSYVLNADATGASKYIRWRNLFENFHFLEDAVEGNSPLLSETLERILSFSPTVVVLAAADNITPWVDLGNAYVSALLSVKLRSWGIYTIGIGPFYSEVPHKFIDCFDSILVGTASPSIIDLVYEKPKGRVVKGKPLDIHQIPELEVLPHNGRDDVVMTSFGCPMRCTFCFAKDSQYVPIPLDLVVRDIERRSSSVIDLGDAILPLQLPRLRDLAVRISEFKKIFTSEISVNTVNSQSLDALCALGVTSLKMGVESGDNHQLSLMEKKQTVDSIFRARDLIRSYGLRLNAYILLGGVDSSDESVERTYLLCRELKADDYIINVMAFDYLSSRDFRYDAHFSQVLVRRWGLEASMNMFFDLQAPMKFGLGELI